MYLNTFLDISFIHQPQTTFPVPPYLSYSVTTYLHTWITHVVTFVPPLVYTYLPNYLFNWLPSWMDRRTAERMWWTGRQTDRLLNMTTDIQKMFTRFNVDLTMSLVLINKLVHTWHMTHICSKFISVSNCSKLYEYFIVYFKFLQQNTEKSTFNARDLLVIFKRGSFFPIVLTAFFLFVCEGLVQPYLIWHIQYIGITIKCK